MKWSELSDEEKPQVLEEYMPRLEELIFVDEKIISTRILSYLLYVGAHISRFLIREIHKKRKDELFTFYECDGRISEKEIVMQRVGQDKLEEAKKKILGDPAVDIHSIQKLGTDTSPEAWRIANLECRTPNAELSPMALPEQKLRVRQMKSYIASDPPKPPEVKKTSEPIEEKVKDVKNEDVEKSSAPSKPASTASKPSKKQTNAKGSKAGSIGQMFGKQLASAAKKPKESKEQVQSATAKEEVINQSSNKEVEEKLSISEDDTAMEVDIEKPSPKVAAKKKTSKNKSKKSSSSAAQSKKRKRIVAASDSESNEEDDVLEEDLPEEPPAQPAVVESDEDEVIPPTPQAKKGRRRIRKLVDKNYEDADGFIITKKEYVYESCSDDGESSTAKAPKTEEEAKEESPSNVKEAGDSKKEKSPKKSSPVIFADVKAKGKSKKDGSPQKGKQTSLMNFFKKK